MKKLTLVTGVLALAFSTSLIAAEKIDWKDCSAEIAKFSCKGSDKDIWTCLEKNDTALGKSCQATHDGPGDALFLKK